MIAEETVKSYSTTLLATVSFRTGTELFAAAFWMGDGAIAPTARLEEYAFWARQTVANMQVKHVFLDVDAVGDPEFSKRVSIGNGRVSLIWS